MASAEYDRPCQGAAPLLSWRFGYQRLQSRDQFRQSVLVGEDRIESGSSGHLVSQVQRSAEADDLDTGKLAAQKRPPSPGYPVAAPGD
jgi:hypothetical protein